MFNFFKKKIEEKKRAEEKLHEEIKIKKENEKKIELGYHSDLLNEVRDEYGAFAGIFYNGFFAIDVCKELISENNIEISNEQIFDTFFEIYKITRNVKSVSEFDNIIEKNGLSLIQKKLRFNPPYCSEINCSSIIYLEKILNVYMRARNTILLSCSTDISDALKEIIDQVQDNIISESRDFAVFVNSCQVVCFLFAFLQSLMRCLIIYRNKDCIISNNELNKIQENLFNEFDIEEAGNKLYELYLEFYSNVFDEVYTTEALTTLMIMINRNKNNIQANMIDDIKNILSEMNDNSLEKITKENIRYDDIISIIAKTIDLKIISASDETKTIYLELIDEIKDNLNDKEIFELFINSRKVANDIKKYIEKKELIEAKNRYLENNFNKEHNYRAERLKLSLIKTGEEFEVYLKNIFEKLGYNVEMTKVTGDQGADLILSKDNIRTVVQAKFYTNTVGNKAVQEVTSAIAFYSADKGMVVTNNYYTKSAIELAKANNIVLWDYDILQEKIDKIINLNN